MCTVIVVLIKQLSSNISFSRFQEEVINESFNPQSLILWLKLECLYIHFKVFKANSYILYVIVFE